MKKKKINTLAYLLMILGVVDYLLAKFMDIHITNGITYIEGNNIVAFYWSPFAFGIVGLILFYINIYFLKPKNVNMSKGSVSQAMTYFISMNNKLEGKIYVTAEKILFDDGSSTFDILYDDVISVSKTKTMKIFPSIEIKTKTKNYIFTGAIGRNKIINAINNLKNNKENERKN